MSFYNVGLNKLDTISVDRLDGNIGYIKENVVLSSKFFNLGRNDVNKDEFSIFIKDNLKIKRG